MGELQRSVIDRLAPPPGANITQNLNIGAAFPGQCVPAALTRCLRLGPGVASRSFIIRRCIPLPLNRESHDGWKPWYRYQSQRSLQSHSDGTNSSGILRKQYMSPRLDIQAQSQEYRMWRFRCGFFSLSGLMGPQKRQLYVQKVRFRRSANLPPWVDYMCRFIKEEIHRSVWRELSAGPPPWG